MVAKCFRIRRPCFATRAVGVGQKETGRRRVFVGQLADKENGAEENNLRSKRDWPKRTSEKVLSNLSIKLPLASFARANTIARPLGRAYALVMFTLIRRQSSVSKRFPESRPCPAAPLCPSALANGANPLAPSLSFFFSFSLGQI